MPAVLPVATAKEETQATFPSTKKQIYVLTAIYPNRAVVSTGGPALFDARNHAPNWSTPLTIIRYHVSYVLYLHISTHTGYRACFRFYYTGIYMRTNDIDDAMRLPGHNYDSSKTNCMPHNAALTCSPCNHTTR